MIAASPNADPAMGLAVVLFSLVIFVIWGVASLLHMDGNFPASKSQADSGSRPREVGVGHDSDMDLFASPEEPQRRPPPLPGRVTPPPLPASKAPRP